MKVLLVILLLVSGQLAFAESPCDVRVGISSGMRVVEFATGHVVHSKMGLKESTADALLEEMINLQDMGVCSEKIQAKKCVLKFEKQNKATGLTLYRGSDRWSTWTVQSKKQAQDFVRHLKRVGFCS